MQSITIRAGEPACKSNSDSRNYTPTYANWQINRNPEGIVDIGVDRDNGETVRICGVFLLGTRAGCFNDVPRNQVEYGPVFFLQPGSIQQTIEYAGISGDIVKFIYAEFAVSTELGGAIARQAFTREFQIDLSEGNMMAYRGALIEVEEATNATINYKLFRGFPE